MRQPPQLLPPSPPLERGGPHAHQPAVYTLQPEATFASPGPPPVFGGADYLRVLRRRRLLIAGFALTGALAGLLISLKQTPAFEAFSRLELLNVNKNFLDLSDVDPNAADGRFQITAESYLLTQVQILQSDSLIERVISRLQQEGTFRPPALEKPPIWKRWFGHRAAPREADVLDWIRATRDDLTVSSSPGTLIIEVSFDSPDPEYSAHFVNALVDEYVDWNAEARLNATQRTSHWLSDQLEDLQNRLRESETRLQTYARASGLLITSEINNVVEGKLKQLQEQYSSAHADRVAYQSRWEMSRTIPAETVPEVRDNSALAGYRQQLSDLEREQAELLAILTPEHYKVKQIAAKISSLKKAIESEQRAVLGRIHTDYQESTRRETLLADAFLQQAGEVSDQAAKTVQYNLLKQEVDTNRQIYETVLAKVKESRIASALLTNNVRIVDVATPPDEPYKPNIPVTVAIGLFVGLFGSVTVVFLSDFADRSIREPGEAGQILQVPEIGVIPSGGSSLAGMLKRMQVRRTCDTEESHPSHLPSTSGHPDANSPVPFHPIELASWQEHASPIAESFRSSVASMLLASGKPARPRILVVTSPSPGEGKSTVASNLAIALARSHPDVLLIDGDLRRPRLHTIFDVPNEKGLSELLAGRGSGKEPVESRIRATQIGGLFLLPAGQPEEDSADLLYSSRLPEMLLRFRQQFHTVLIDTGPLLPFSDARLFGRLADGVLLVFRSGQTGRDEAHAARRRLQEDGTPLLGIILNDWNPRASGSRMYQKYYRYYGPG